VKFSQFLYLLEKEKNTQSAINLLEEVTSDHRQGKATLPAINLKQFKGVSWNQASTFYEEGKYREAFEWFRRCEQLLSANDREVSSQCDRLMARCMFLLGEYNKALAYALKSQEIETVPSGPGMVLLFDIYLEQKNEEQSDIIPLNTSSSYLAMETLVSILEKADDDRKAGLLELCAHRAFEVIF